jgi:hypothetical protein
LAWLPGLFSGFYWEWSMKYMKNTKTTKLVLLESIAEENNEKVRRAIVETNDGYAYVYKSETSDFSEPIAEADLECFKNHVKRMGEVTFNGFLF